MTGAPPPPPPPPPRGTPPPPPSPPPSNVPPPPGNFPGTPPPPPGSMPTAPPHYGAAPQGRNGLAVASLVLGILSIPLCFVFVPALLAVIFGAIALGQIKSNPSQAGRGQAIAGLILGVVSLAFIVLAIAVSWDDATFEFESSLLAMLLTMPR